MIHVQFCCIVLRKGNNLSSLTVVAACGFAMIVSSFHFDVCDAYIVHQVARPSCSSYNKGLQFVILPLLFVVIRVQFCCIFNFSGKIK